VVRYGGEEFAIILPDMDREGAYRLAEKMRYSIEAKKVRHEHSTISDYVTISLGVNTVIPSNNLSAGDLIRTADKALYKAKQEQRNKVVAV
jgi:diguanylate cyclase (GGDEF)-like protein